MRSFYSRYVPRVGKMLKDRDRPILHTAARHDAPTIANAAKLRSSLKRRARYITFRIGIMYTDTYFTYLYIRARVKLIRIYIMRARYRRRRRRKVNNIILKSLARENA